LVDDHLAALRTAREKWTVGSAENLRAYSDYAVIETGEVVGAYKNTMMHTLHGFLGRRNECAHPSDYFPDLNSTLGYVSDLIDRIKRLEK
jgi:hypothetical protein